MPETADATPDRVTYLLIDGENLDTTLGGILGRRPAPQERPRWDKVVDFVGGRWGQPVRPLFFINATHGELPMPFLQALMAMGIRPVPLRGGEGVKVVDVGIQRTLDAIVDRAADVCLASHDGDFLPQIDALLDDTRQVSVLGFREYFNTGYPVLRDRGLEMWDLEDAPGVFTSVLPRLRVIDLDEFDPASIL